MSEEIFEPKTKVNLSIKKSFLEWNQYKVGEVIFIYKGVYEAIEGRDGVSFSSEWRQWEKEITQAVNQHSKAIKQLQHK